MGPDPINELTRVIPFSVWMEKALFDPLKGYYTARIQTVGRRGDFSTSTTIDDLLARAIAEWIRRSVQKKHSRCVIEIGGGDGSLSSAIRKHLGWWTGRKLAWHMVEKSPVLRQKQAEKLNPGRTTWHETIEKALLACEGRALIFHNELLDAFPVTVMDWNPEAENWNELWLEEHPEKGWVEKLQPLNPQLNAAIHYTACADWPPGSIRKAPHQRIEVGSTCRDWLTAWAPYWKQGSMLTIDYGAEFPEIYRRRPQGTLRAYLLHQMSTGKAIYQNMGRQDITADVNFTDLQKWGEALGWHNESILTQAQFIQNHVSISDSSPASAFLMDENGAGTAFKVLVQHASGSQNHLRA